ncbi:hypothetical protein MVEN_00656900 [Mycena venus]|uniref:Uncharacterized protein n=1 Tax=Mycena venus TaxID=2733690 RepID=A0A8H6YRJ5_9AGAR|nr:hypothetical protein MVEN_00656900 [Mycena venus]
MFLTSFIARYRFVYALCLLQIVSGVATLALYGADGSVASKVIQVAPTVYALITALKIHRMLSYAHRADPSQPLSRVEGQYLLLIYMVGMWVLCILVSFWPQYRRFSTMLASCLSTNFPANLKCVSLATDIVFPFSILGAVYSALRALQRRAVELHGADMVAIPVECSLSVTYPQNLIEAWMLPHVADLTTCRGRDPREISGR